MIGVLETAASYGPKSASLTYPQPQTPPGGSYAAYTEAYPLVQRSMRPTSAASGDNLKCHFCNQTSVRRDRT